MSEPLEVKLTRKQIKAALRDIRGSAEIVNLTYTSDNVQGITRVIDDDKFIYFNDGKPITDSGTLLRIKSLGIPPAWSKVWICNDENGHLQVTGFDNANRKQYRYHPLWNRVRKETKFYRMLDFGLKLPSMRQRVEKDLNSRDFSKQKILAALISILDSASLRIGNSVYEKLHGSYGLTTLRKKHVKIEGTKIRFCFIGKKGVQQTITIKSRKLSNILRRVREIPGQKLFEFYNETNDKRSIDSGMVNEYIKEISGGDYTAKDFRTWAGSVSAIRAYSSLGNFETNTEFKRKTNLMYDMVAQELGNTRGVVKNHYVHPIVVQLYENYKLFRYIEKQELTNVDNLLAQLKPEERTLIMILRAN